VALTEKGKHGKVTRHQPISRELFVALDAHSRARGPGEPGSAVFFYKDSTPAAPHPLTKKRYETLTTRIRLALPWAGEQWMKFHDLRRTGITMIERISGSPAIARLFAGHRTGTALDTYDAADEEELEAALAQYLGRPAGTAATDTPWT
jgi:integrase